MTLASAPPKRRSWLRVPSALGCAYLFFANGFMFANWAVRIPAVKAALGIGEAALGFALLFYALGAIVAMPLNGALITRFGSGRVAMCAGLAYCLGFFVPTAAPSLPLLCLGLAAVGFTNGAMDVAMNAQADAVEKRLDLRCMSGCHGMFSLGLALGALPAGLFAAAGVAPASHLLVVGVVLALPFAFLPRRFVADASSDPDAPVFAWPRGPLLLLGLLAFCGAVTEGAMNDWIAVYVRETLAAGPAAAAWCFGAFATAMCVARFFGDALITRFGAVVLARVSLLTAAAGITLALAVSDPLVAALGFALAGLGCAPIFPIVFSAAGRMPGHAPGPSMAAAITLGYAGFVGAPPVIGFLAQATSLPLALGVTVLLALVGAMLAGVTRVADRATPSDAAISPTVAAGFER